MPPSLTGDEMIFLQDTELFLKKRAITEKIIHLFIETENRLKNVAGNINFPFPEGTLIKAGKISKGENYNGLPYIVLDFPRLLKNNNFFLFRWLMWWGNGFQLNFLCQGESLENFRNKLVEKKHLLSAQSYFIGVGENPWKLEMTSDNFKYLNELPAKKIEFIIKTSKYIKIMEFLPFSEYDQVPEKSCLFLNRILDLLQ